jgi:protein arginine kinase
MNEWYLQDGKHNDIVISTRIRLARNIVGFPFKTKILPEQQAKLNETIKDSLSNIHMENNCFEFLDMGTLKQIDVLSMVENHIISVDFAEEPKGEMLVLSNNKDISIMVCEEDHLRIQVMRNGLELNEALDLANKIDNVLDERLDYAFSEQLGFLTVCPTNLGTGLRASVMLHLPGLEQAGAIGQLANTIPKLGLTIRGTFGEGSKAKGSVYQISNQITLGISEEMAIQNLESIVMQIISQEKDFRKNFLEDKPNLEDKIFRSLGILKNSRLLSNDEFSELISNVRLGISMDIIKDIDIKLINRLMSVAGSASICSFKNQTLSSSMRDFERSAVVREMLGSS